jgi:hypothetical protein
MDNSPKIHFLKNSEGKFYNSRSKTYFPMFINANYERDRKVLDYLIQERFTDHEVHTVTEHEFMEEMAAQTTNCVLAGEYFSNLLFKLSCVLPTVSQVNKTMYQKCKSAIEVLKPFTTMHHDFISQKEDQTDEVQGYYAEYIAEVSKIQIHHAHEVTLLLKAYQKDRASMLGITKKVLK